MKANQGTGRVPRITTPDRCLTALEAIQSKRKIWIAPALESFSLNLSHSHSSSPLPCLLLITPPHSSSTQSKQLPAASFTHAALNWWRIYFPLTTTKMLLIRVKFRSLTQNYFLFVLPRLWWRLLSRAPNNANSDKVGSKHNPDLCIPGFKSQ